MTPPSLALWLVDRLLPGDLSELVSGDLQEEWLRLAGRSRLRFWRSAIGSIGAYWFERLLNSPVVEAFTGSPFASDGRERERSRVMLSLWQDLTYGTRVLRRNKAFTVAAVATLGLGIGANTAIFSIVNVLTLKPLVYRDAPNVAFVLGWDNREDEMRFSLRQADYLDLRRQAKSFEAVAAYSYMSANLTGGDVPDRVQAYRVTPNTFSLLGVAPETGRVFEERDVADGHAQVAVLSHGLWQRRFGGDSGIVGRQVVVNGTPHEIVGVMPKAFEYPVFNFKGELWIPWEIRDAERGQSAASGGATIVGRIRPGVSYAQAQAEVDTLMSGFAARHPETNRGTGARLTGMGELDDQQAGPAFAVVLATVAFVLLLASANVANLLLAKSASRRRELAVRAAMGASRLRIARQLLIESLILAAAGGLVGVLLAFAALGALSVSLPEAVITTVPNIHELGVDRDALRFTVIVSLLTSLVFGAFPSWRASRQRFDEALKESASAGGSLRTRRLRSALVVSEVALATALMVGALLLVRSYDALQRLGPGFEATSVMTAAVTLPDYAYENPAARRRFFEEFESRVARLPGVTDVGLVNVLPFSTYDRGARLTVDGDGPVEPGREPSVAFRVATPGYQHALRVPLIAGRAFEPRDVPEGAPVALVNETLARRHLRCVAASCLGRRVRLGASSEPWLTVVGVIGDVRHSSLTQKPAPEIHVPMAQTPTATMMVAARTTLPPEELSRSIQTVVREIDPAQPLYHLKTLEALVDDSTLASRVSARLMALFGALALALAAIGTYGVVAYGVSQQTREFGVRMALGASRLDVIAIVLRKGGVMVGSGIVLGLVGGFALSSILAGSLVGVSPTDPLTYTSVAVLLALTGFVACALPAWRASATRPVSALRAD